MRVTKAIREYVEHQVSLKVQQSELLAELKQKAQNEEQNFLDDFKSIRSEYEEKLKGLVGKYKIDKKHSNGIGDFTAHYLPANIQYRCAENELLKKKTDAITEILATMELGGTKAELMEMINNLKF